MKTIYRLVPRNFAIAELALFLLFLSMTPGASASAKIERGSGSVTEVAHLLLPGTPVTQTVLQEQGGKEYLFIQQASQPGFTIVDVTKPERPEVVKRVNFPNDIHGERLQMVGAGLVMVQESDPETGNAHLEPAHGKAEGTLGGGASDSNGTGFVRLLDLGDPLHPRTVQTFYGVTSILADDSRNLIYVTNRDGLWVLHHKRDLAREICGEALPFSEMVNCDAY